MNNLEVRYLGTEGSYSHEIALRFINDEKLQNFDLNSYETITDIIIQPTKYQETIIVLPLENTTSGDVYETFYQIYKNDFNIIATYELEINHVLITKESTDRSRVTDVYSHPQALMQVTQYLLDNKLNGIPDFSTADAMKRVSQSSEDIAAIGSKFSLKYFDNLIIVDEDVNNSNVNYTRFMISKWVDKKVKYRINLNQTTKSGYLFLLFELNQDKSGELTLVLDLLSKYNINLFNIKSRPTQGNAFEYFFVVEAMVEDVDHKIVVEKLKMITKSFVYNTYNK